MKSLFTQHRKSARNTNALHGNNWKETSNYWNTAQYIPVIDRKPPGSGYKHFLKKRDIVNFISILPDWETVSKGLNAIILSQGYPSTEGIHYPYYGIIEICAWNEDMWIELVWDDYVTHKELLSRIGVPCEKRQSYYLCKFNEQSIKAYQLLHIFLHELGHHYDQMTTRSKFESSRGEGFAEEYAYRHEQEIINRYFDLFGY